MTLRTTPTICEREESAASQMDRDSTRARAQDTNVYVSDEALGNERATPPRLTYRYSPTFGKSLPNNT
jgi:hypothetical protein